MKELKTIYVFILIFLSSVNLLPGMAFASDTIYDSYSPSEHEFSDSLNRKNPHNRKFNLLNDSLQFFLQKENKSKTAYYWFKLGQLHEKHLNYRPALEMYDNALVLYRSEGELANCCNILHSIGNIYLQVNNLSMADTYFSEGIQLSYLIDDLAYTALFKQSIGELLAQAGLYNEALKELNAALEILRHHNVATDKVYYIKILKAELYLKWNKISKAIAEINAIPEKEITDLHIKANYYITQGNIAEKQKQQIIAASYYEQGLGTYLSGNDQYPFEELELHKKLSDIYMQTGDTKTALFHLGWHAAISDSLITYGLTTVYDYNRFILNINLSKEEFRNLSQKHFTLAQEVERQQQVKKMLILIISISVALLILLFLMVRRRRKSVEDYKLKNKTQQELIRQLNETSSELKLLNATKDRLFSIIGHDLKNPFNAILGFSEILAKRVQDNPDENIKKYATIINNTSHEMYALLENILDWSRSQRDKVAFNPEVFDLYSSVVNIYTLLEINALQKNIELVNLVEKDTPIFADKDLVLTILRNLLSNAIKFTHEKGQVTVSAHYEQDYIEVWVADNGIGISKKDVEKLFRVDVNYSSSGTSSEKGTGLGLLLCKDFIEMHEGNIWVESTINAGSIFKFTLPINKEIRKKIKNR